MTPAKPRFPRLALIFLCVLAAPLAAQTPWIHTEVTGEDGSHVKVNAPLPLAEAAVSIMPRDIQEEIMEAASEFDIDIADLRKLWQAVKAAGDAEFVTVESAKETVRIVRAGDLIQIRVTETAVSEDAAPAEHKVAVDVPIDVIEALLSGDSETLNIEAAVGRLQQMRGDIVRVNDGKNKVRVWIDEKS